MISYRGETSKPEPPAELPKYIKEVISDEPESGLKNTKWKEKVEAALRLLLKKSPDDINKVKE